jgi:alpha-L-rhamnosidase
VIKHLVLQPDLAPTGRITHVVGAHESPYGEIRSEWQVDDKTTTLLSPCRMWTGPVYVPDRP